MPTTYIIVSMVVLLVFANSRKCTTCKGPIHSWATVPASFHASRSKTGPDGRYTDADLMTIKKFPLVTIEKWQGSSAFDNQTKSDVFLWEEDAWIAAAKSVKAVNPNASVVVWMDTMLIYTGWNTKNASELNRTLNPDIKKPCSTGHFRPAEFLEKNPSYLLKNSTHQSALEPWSGCHIYDHSQPLVRKYWTDMCLNMTASGVIDGCGADFSAMEQNNWGWHIPSKIREELHLDNATAYAWAAGHQQMMNETQIALGDGLLVGKDWKELGDHVNGVIQEGCNPTLNKTIVMFRHLTSLSQDLGRTLVYQCHLSRGVNIDHVAGFLIGAGVGHYLSIGGWNGGNFAGHWNELFGKPLGEPLSDGMYDPISATWTRSFRMGTNVTFNAKTNTGTVEWGTRLAHLTP